MNLFRTFSATLGGLFALHLLPTWVPTAAGGPEDEICQNVRGSSAWALCTAAVAQDCQSDSTQQNCERLATNYERQFGLNPPWLPYTAFVTSVGYFADLGGLSGADDECNDLASDAGLTGYFKAWLSDSADSPSTRFTRAMVPYVLLDGTLVADNWDDLASGALQHQIDLDENRQLREGDVWTGTLTDGSADPLGYHCDGWTRTEGPWPPSSPGLGRTGRSDRASGHWTDANAFACSRTNPDVMLYCFEQ